MAHVTGVRALHPLDVTKETVAEVGEREHHG